MAILGKLIREKNDCINFRSGDVLGDVIIEKDYLQLRTYAKGDLEREDGSKQNIQFDKKMAKEFRAFLNEFIDGK
ncbi:hypothetical protein Q2T41_16940 [Maribacter confluentis]|uniref:Uncharacterized protein n=1 Tax=Maribacter confluentis TaxID=1656093 RepID=A0ABT8RTX0_9FLAO|nr:hypothetical protein [Maribacter confluentis]MDO1514343.1 hypothetical protein [Maribacter confluentis]